MKHEPRRVLKAAHVWEEHKQPDHIETAVRDHKPAPTLRQNLLVLAMVVLLPQLFLGAIISYRYADDARREVERRTISSSERYALDLERYLEGAVASVQALAGSVQPDNLRDLYDRARRLLPLRGSAVVMRDRTGQQIINTTLPFGASLPRTESNAVREADAQVFATGQVVYSDVYLGTTNKRWFVLFDVPVNMNGQVEYALNIAIAADELRDRVFQQMPEGWMGVILDRNHKIIARTIGHDRYVGQQANVSIVDGISSREAGTVRSTTLDGVDVFASFVKSPASGWTTVISAPVKSLEAPVRALWRDLILLALLSVSFSAAAAIIWSRKLVYGMRKIKHDALLLADENRITQVSTGISELDDLNTAMIDVSGKLYARSKRQRALIAELNHRVKNTLAIVQSITGRTVTEGGGDSQIASVLTGRVAALAAAHDALTHADWGDTDLEDLVRRLAELNGLKIDVNGPRILLTPKTTVALAQVMHELAWRHGRPDRAEFKEVCGGVSWQVCEEQLCICWRDPPTSLPAGKATGFSEKIIELSINRQLDGSYKWVGSETGWTFEALVPLRSSLSHNARPA